MRLSSSITLRCQEIAAAIVRAEASLTRLRNEFAELHRTLERFQGDPEIAPLVRSSGQRGDLLRTVLSVLRLSNGPMETRDVTVRTLRDLGMDADNPRVVKVMQERVRMALLRQERAGVVQADRCGMTTTWVIGPAAD